MAVTPPPAPLITRAQLESRVSATVLDRVLDDSGSGEADVDAVQRILLDASSKIRGALGPLTDLNTLDPEKQTEVVRIALDIATAYLALRHPEILKRDGFTMLDRSEKELAGIHVGKADLGTEEDPQVYQSASVYSDAATEWGE
jgi:phage gp36-like protein